MATAIDGYFREQLLARRRRIQDALADGIESARLGRLLGDVDQALARLDGGTFGICETCHDPIEADRLIADPLLRFCLDHLTEAEQRDLERDLELAARIQHGLVPSPRVRRGPWDVASHFEPAGAVSGDYLDLVDAPTGDDLLFVIGDVSGKGMSAAILMAHLRAIFHSLVGAAPPVAELVAHANRVFRESTLAPYFATLVCGRCRPDGDVEIANAGHCPPLVMRAAGAETLGPTGLPLGVAAAGPYGVHHIHLERGDTLVLYTDGVSEALDADEEQYGDERVRAAALASRHRQPDEVIAACLGDLASFAGRAPRRDDVTMLVIRRT